MSAGKKTFAIAKLEERIAPCAVGSLLGSCGDSHPAGPTTTGGTATAGTGWGTTASVNANVSSSVNASVNASLPSIPPTGCLGGLSNVADIQANAQVGCLPVSVAAHV